MNTYVYAFKIVRRIRRELVQLLFIYLNIRVLQVSPNYLKVAVRIIMVTQKKRKYDF